MKSGIYQVINSVNRKSYIGSTVDLKKREYAHFSRLRAFNHPNILLRRAFVKYGDVFEFNILELCPKDKLLEREQYYLDSIYPEYNINPTAGNSLGVRHRQETIEKIKVTQTGKRKTKSTKDRISLSNRGNKSKTGQITPLDTRKKISQSLRGNKEIVQLSLDGKELGIWNSLQEVQDSLGIHKSHVSKCCLKQRKTAGGYIWQYR